MSKLTLLDDELQTAASALSVQRSDIKFSAPVRLYRSSTSKWVYQNSYGVVTICVDSSSNSVLIRLVDLNTHEVTLNQECYKGFDYKILSDNFHCFESDSDHVGLLFAERFDASTFGKQVSQLIKMMDALPGNMGGNTSPVHHQQPSVPPKVERTPSADSTSPTVSTNPPPKKIVTTTPTKEPEKKPEKKEGGFFGRFFGGKKDQPAQSDPRANIKISGPKIEKFQHVSHIGFDPKKGFTEIPLEWQKIFEKAGISSEELKDKKTAKFLLKTIASVEKQEGAQSMTAPPSMDLPPTPSKRTGPPPIPGKLTAGSSSGPTGSAAIGVGGNVPPPPTNVPPPPTNVPKPITPTEIGSRPSVSSGSSSSGGGGDLLAEIQSKKLKTVKQEDLPDVGNMADSEQDSLAASIARAMEARRGRVELSDSEEEEDDDDWEL